MRRRFPLTVLLLSFALAQGCVFEIDDDEDSTLTIRNSSDFALDEIRVTETDDPDFGPNLLGGDLLLPGEEIIVFLECDVYDVLVVDEEGFGCELIGLELCFTDALWIITNSTLNECEFVQGQSAMETTARSVERSSSEFALTRLSEIEKT